ncbi:hypothetical protein PNI0446_00515 [Streptococcus pneumoniae PNI0446]|nr:hypothetical protein PNI0446_00515 [Streptococcus pneumoniae PNI0446]
MSWRCSSFLIAGSGAYFSSQLSGFKILSPIIHPKSKNHPESLP